MQKLATRTLLALWGVTLLSLPAQLIGQTLAREALASLPADTQQLAYTNLADLRRLSNYAQIRKRLLMPQLRELEKFAHSIGIDPEKDIDEVVLAWRGPESGDASFFGIAEGHFQPERVREFFAQHELPVHNFEVWNLYAIGSRERPGLFFAFLDSSSVAFGHLNDLKAALEVRAGTRPALDSNPVFAHGKAELEGAAPQWGIASGKAVTIRAMPWLGAGEKHSLDLNTFLGPVEAVLYKVEWGSSLSTRISILCRNPESAQALAQVLTLWRNSQPPTSDGPSLPVIAFLSQLEVQASGSTVELTASAPVETLDQMFGVPTSASAP